MNNMRDHSPTTSVKSIEVSLQPEGPKQTSMFPRCIASDGKTTGIYVGTTGAGTIFVSWAEDQQSVEEVAKAYQRACRGRLGAAVASRVEGSDRKSEEEVLKSQGLTVLS